jgi:hypothetical protein
MPAPLATILPAAPGLTADNLFLPANRAAQSLSLRGGNGGNVDWVHGLTFWYFSAASGNVIFIAE